MKLVTYQKDAHVYTGILVDSTIQRLDSSLPMQALIAGEGIPNITNMVDNLSDVKLLSPVMPGKILAIGRNYAEHAKELNNQVPTKPLIFAVVPSAVIGTGDTIEWEDELTQQVDWEGELAVVIGKTARHVAEEDALDYVFGYMVANDVSARDLQNDDKQWTRAKGMDTFCPMGPCILTADEIPDPHDLRIITRVDGEIKQDGNTADMIFKIPFLVAYLSRMFTLNAGDVILTGTPSGVGRGMNPPEFLGEGSVVEIEIERIGTISNPCHVVMTEFDEDFLR